MTLDEAVKGTFLEKVAETLASGQFIEPDEEVDPGETVIGEMEPLEKAFYTVGKQIHSTMLKKIPDDDSEPPLELVQEAVAATMTIEAMTSVTGALIENRLNSYNDQISGLGYRKGFKIVTIPLEPELVFIPAMNGFAPPGGTPPKIGSA